MNYRHRAAPKHVGGSHHQRQSEVSGDEPRLLDRIGDAVLRLLQPELVKQAFKPIAVFGEIDRIDRRSEDRRAGLLDPMREFQRRLAAELDDDAFQAPPFALLVEYSENVLRG